MHHLLINRPEQILNHHILKFDVQYLKMSLPQIILMNINVNETELLFHKVNFMNYEMNNFFLFLNKISLYYMQYTNATSENMCGYENVV